MLSTRPVKAPAALLDKAAGRPPALTLVVGADHAVAFESAKQATDAGLIEPVLIGDPIRIAKLSEERDWDVSAFRKIDASGDQALADAATHAAGDPALKAVMKGQIHTDALMGAMLRRESGIRTGRRLSHIFHMSVPDDERAFLISDAALNVAPDLKTFQAITENMVTLGHALGMERPRFALLSATEEPLPQMPSSLMARSVADWASGADLGAEIAGPLAFDNAVSPEAAAIKGLADHPVAGQADGVIVPTIEVGNAL
ncbi:MAG: phosphate acyltransferase, partial [Pseudomonadota bacterium]